jgi:hypothetical protein
VSVVVTESPTEQSVGRGAADRVAQGEKKIPKGTIEIYLVEGTPQEVIDAAIAEFGEDHVHIFPDPGKK